MPTATQEAIATGEPETFTTGQDATTVSFSSGSGPADETSTTNDANVVNISLFAGELRAIDYLANAGLIKPEQRFDLNMIKLINHAAYAQYGDEYRVDDGRTITQLQAQFREDGDVKALVDGYLSARANHAKHAVKELDAIPFRDDPSALSRRRDRAEERVRKYVRDRDTYRKNPDMLDGIAAKYPQAVALGKYLPIGRLALAAGMIDGDPAAAADRVDDVLANATAHSLLLIAHSVMTTTPENLARYREFRNDYAGNIVGKAYDVATHTTPLDKIQIFDEGAPETLKIQALNTLLSTQLNAMTAASRNPQGKDVEHLAEALPAIRELVQHYQQAAMSLVYHFLKDGPGANDARMDTLAAQLKETMESNGVGTPLDKAQAQQAASNLAYNTVKYLAQGTQDKPELRGKLAALLKQVDSERSLPLSLPSTGVVAEQAGSHVERLGKQTPGAAIAIGGR